MKLFNTLTRKNEELQTLTDKEVLFYTCGLTVYSQPHIGNWVGYIYWDVLNRYLTSLGFEVKHVQNITDVGHLVSDDDNGEDKMEKGARKEGLSAWQVADKYMQIADSEAYEMLALKRPVLVRATDCIPEQIEFVSELEKLGFTYEIPGEGIYFDTSKLSDYGKLAQLDIDGLKEGARVEFKNKKNITDFALWKFSPHDSKRDMEWKSPWGTGFPGWHLECSTIAYKNLGPQIDIHAGGVDHIPIHHTNEIAQTESLTGKTMSSMWIHNNHLKVDGKKMSKSEGNIYTLQDIINKEFNLLAFKLLVLSKNYHTEGNFTWEILLSAQNRLNNWQASADLRWQFKKNGENITKEISEALSDNLNTPEAIKIIDLYFSDVEKKNVSPNELVLNYINDIFGINLIRGDLNKEQKELLNDRQKARDAKDWQKSDSIRDQLLSTGINVRDEKNGQIWNRL